MTVTLAEGTIKTIDSIVLKNEQRNFYNFDQFFRNLEEDLARTGFDLNLINGYLGEYRQIAEPGFKERQEFAKGIGNNYEYSPYNPRNINVLYDAGISLMAVAALPLFYKVIETLSSHHYMTMIPLQMAFIFLGTVIGGILTIPAGVMSSDNNQKQELLGYNETMDYNKQVRTLKNNYIKILTEEAIPHPNLSPQI